MMHQPEEHPRFLFWLILALVVFFFIRVTYGAEKPLPTVTVQKNGKVKVKGISKDKLIRALLDERDADHAMMDQAAVLLRECAKDKIPGFQPDALIGEAAQRPTSLELWQREVERQREEALKAKQPNYHDADFDRLFLDVDRKAHKFWKTLQEGTVLPAKDWKEYVAASDKLTGCKRGK